MLTTQDRYHFKTIRMTLHPFKCRLLPALLAGGASVLCLCGFGLWLWLTFTPPPPLLQGVTFSPLVLDRHGELLRMGLTPDEKYRVRVRLAEIAPEAVQALLLYEDRHYYSHPGVNPLALGRAAVAMLQGGRRMGGSTITMQVARLRFNLDTTTLGGKLRQMLLALHLERHYTKKDILEAYFCLAPYGGNVEGLAAAARVYFKRPPSRLSLTESLALAIVPQNPVRRSPLSGPDFSVARARMERLWRGAHPTSSTPFVSGPLADATFHGSPLTNAPLRVFGPKALPFAAPHASAALLTAWDFATQSDPLTTTLDRPLQRLLENRLTAFAARGRIYGLHNAAALLLHWPSMEIRALVGSADFNNPHIFGQVDGTLARRSPGSTLKPFIYALALDQGLIHPQSLLVDSPRSFGGYDPENFDRSFRGPLPAHEALRTSRNIPAIQLAAKLSPDLYAFLRRAEVQLPKSPEHYGLSLVLGGAEVSMRELVELYAMLPNKGVYRPARLLRAVDSPSPARSLLSPEAAILTLRMLEEPGRNLKTSRGLLPLRYKTGTSNRFRDAWTVGLVGSYVLAVWVGNFDNAPNPLLIGGEVAAPLFEDTARALTLHEPIRDLIADQQAGLNLIRIPVCTDTGDLDTALCRSVTETWYIPGRSPTRSSGVYRPILIDNRTGLRACFPSEHTREVIWEFWPSDLQALFARAGVIKPSPPPFSPECNEAATTPALSIPGSEPRILSPRDGVVYQRRVGDEHSGRNAIPLLAGTDADADTVFWFANNQFIGKAASQASIMWHPNAGVHTIRALDNLGRTTSLRVRVEIVK